MIMNITLSIAGKPPEIIEDVVEEATSMDILILTGEIIGGSFILFIIARLIYGCIQNVEFAVEPELEVPLVPTLDPDCLLAKKIAKLKEESG